MSRIAALRANIAQLDHAMAQAESTAAEFPGVELMREGLASMKEEITQEVRLARRARLQVIMLGPPVTGHEIRIDALARVLHSLQESISSTAQALIGRATTSASLPGPLREMTALSLSEVFDGSFGAVLRGPADGDDEQQTALLDDEDIATLLDHAVERVLGIVDLANSEAVSDEPIVESVLPLGGRAFKHLNELSATILDEDLTANLDFSSPATQPHATTLGRAAARRLSDVLGRNRMTERVEAVEGRLGTASDLRNQMELETDEGIIKATVPEDLLSLLAVYFTRRVLATFQVSTVTSLTTWQERRSYVLMGLADLPGSSEDDSREDV